MIIIICLEFDLFTLVTYTSFGVLNPLEGCGDIMSLCKLGFLGWIVGLPDGMRKC